jgi:uncharacterized protein with HEPN domain
MTKSHLPYLQDIVNAIIQIEAYIEESDYLKKQETLSALLLDGIMRQIEIIGEASRNIPREIQLKYSNIPWRYMIGTRNIIAYEYSRVDVDIIWEIVHSDLPTLKEDVKKIIEKEQKTLG